MKKGISFCLLILAAASLFAVDIQDSKKSDFYVKSVPITKIYAMKEGYRVLYMKSNMEFATFYVPIEWTFISLLTGEEPKAEVFYGAGKAYPYFSIFWRGGTFHHIRLYLIEDPNDSSWGALPPGFDLEGKFDVSELDLEF